MLAMVGTKDEARLQTLLDRRPAEAVRLAGLLKAYGLRCAFLDFYLQNGGDAVLARIDENFLLFEPVPARADAAELARFLRLSPRFAHLLGARETLARVGAQVPGSALQGHVRMVNAAGAPLFARPVERQPDLRAVSAFLRRMGQHIADAWYTDLSHRLRHGCARAFLVRDEEQQAAAACLVSAESRAAGLISNVLTAPAFRRRGFGTAVVAAAAGDLIADGKCAVIECAPALTPFYARLGFLPQGETGTLRAGTE